MFHPWSVGLLKRVPWDVERRFLGLDGWGKVGGGFCWFGFVTGREFLLKSWEFLLKRLGVFLKVGGFS